MKLVLGLDNDAYGKYFEIMTSYYLLNKFPDRPKERECFKTKTYRQHKSKSKFDTTTTETYLEDLLAYFNPTKEQIDIHNSKAFEASQVLHEYFNGIGHEVINVFWTSNKNDLLWLFGQDNTNPSDIVVKTRGPDPNRPFKTRTFLTGIVLKNHNKRARSTMANLGVSTMDTLFRSHTKPIADRVREKVLLNTKKYGIDISQPISTLHQIEKTIPELHESNAQLMVNACRLMVNQYRSNLFEFNNEELRDVLIKVIHGEPTKIRTIHLKSYGTEINKFQHDLACHTDIIEKLFSRHENYLHIKNTSGRSIIFAGKDDVSIAAVGIKGKTSGGFTAVTGRVQGIFSNALT